MATSAVLSTPVAARPDLEALFLAHLTVTDRILAAVSRRNGLSADDADEFAGWAKLRLIENDYAVLGKFRGQSTLATYLSVVIAMLYREYRVAEWGRWRPSAAAKRSGKLAVRLETLVGRDGFGLAQAGQLLRTAGVTTLSDRELAQVAARLPRRSPLRPVEVREAPVEAEARNRADDLVESEESAAELATVKRALHSALEGLALEDRLIVRMHFMDAMSIADISRALSLPQKPLYRRLERALMALRKHLERAGVSRGFALQTG